jgi:hypothetical protein
VGSVTSLLYVVVLSRGWPSVVASKFFAVREEMDGLVVDVEDAPETRQYFVERKPTLLERFEQIEIYIASYPIDIVRPSSDSSASGGKFIA